MKLPIYYLLQFTWGLIQNCAGFLWFLRYLRKPHSLYHGAFLTRVRRKRFQGGWTLGCFIFLTEPMSPETERDLLIHEYGHTIQSLILGPFWSLSMGLPSTLWCHLPCFRRMRKEKHIPYSALFCEKWANRLGQKVLGQSIRRDW